MSLRDESGINGQPISSVIITLSVAQFHPELACEGLLRLAP
jgi:hypothetical protein